ncbi:hypothetical protein [Pseudidiomarina insulisalsae]|uniref:Lipoprotein n=1 Tax=Pseudidiomarina insulisalsae TaxID=575789 RepID=A0A432YET1_9GAMM|nr:hypothetical protein [Pseudidiomarina insulisalsae]RUO59462.1 hypothetical protein CWI71_08530 [Pseudidiomarina insulisalsae]
MSQKLAWVMISGLLLSGCSAAGWYYSWQDERLERCRELHSESQRMECERRATESYEEYQRKRQQVLKDAEKKT